MTTTIHKRNPGFAVRVAVGLAMVRIGLRNTKTNKIRYIDRFWGYPIKVGDAWRGERVATDYTCVSVRNIQ